MNFGAPSRVEQFLINVGILLDDLFVHMGEVEFDLPVATRLKSMKSGPFFVLSKLPGCGLAVPQLLGSAAVGDRSSYAS